MGLTLGNIATGIGKTAKDTVTSAGSSVLSNMGTMAKGIGKQVFGQVTGANTDPIYESPYPLGNEWIPDPAYTVTFQFTDRETGAQDFVQGYIPDTISMGISAEYNSPLENIGNSLSGGKIGMIASMFGYKLSSNIFSVQMWGGSSHIDLSFELRFIALTNTTQEVITPIRKLTRLVTPYISSFSQTDSPVQLGRVDSPGPSFEYIGDANSGELTNLTDSLTQGVDTLKTGLGDTAKSVSDGTADTKSVISGIGGAVTESVGGFFNNALQNLRVKNNISVKVGQFAILKSVVIKNVSPTYNVKADADGNIIDATVSVQVSTFISPTSVDVPHLVGFTVPDAVAGSDGESTEVSSLDESLEIGSDLYTPSYLTEGANEMSIMSSSGILNGMDMTANNPIGEVSSGILSNPESMGLDSGLASHLLGSDSSGVTYEDVTYPGMSSSDAQELMNK